MTENLPHQTHCKQKEIPVRITMRETVFVPITRNMNKLTTVERNLCRLQKYEVYNAREH